MKFLVKTVILIILFIFYSLYSSAQHNAIDSAWAVWNNETLDDTTRGNALIKIGVELNQKDIDSAMGVFDLLLAFAEDKNLSSEKATAINGKGLLNMSRGKFQEAVQLFDQAIAIGLATGDSDRVLNSNINKGNAFFYQGLLTQALKVWRLSRQFAKAMPNQNAYDAFILGNIGNIYAMQGEYVTAISIYEQSLDKTPNDMGQRAVMLSNIGYAYAFLGRYRKAIKYSLESIELELKNGSIYEVNNYRINVIEAYYKMENYDSALVFLNKIKEDEIDSRGLIGFFINKGEVVSAIGNHLQGVEFCLKGLELATMSKMIEEKRNACECLYNTYKLMGEGIKALEYHEKMIVFSDSIKLNETSKKLQQMEFESKLLTDSLNEAEEKRIALAEVERIAASRSRKNRIQYSLVVIVVLLLATIIAIATKFSISPRLASGLIFIFFILLFEFLLVVLDPWVDSISNGEVGWKIGINTAIALVLFGVHQVSEKRLKSVILKENK